MLETKNWIKCGRDLTTEWRQLQEEGKDVEVFRKVCEALEALSWQTDCEEAAKELFTAMERTKVREDYPYAEPSSYEEISRCAEGNEVLDWRSELGEEALREKITGAWLGRISGCLLGKPFECLRSDMIGRILKAADNYPLNRYVDSGKFPEGLAEEADNYPNAPWRKMWIDRVKDAAPVDDDTNYTVLALKLVEEYGTDFRPNDVLEAWLYWMPMFDACTAERAAYRNAAMGLYAPDTAKSFNPYREWIGAQIRGDFFGYINPGNPVKAAEMAWRDASVSHVKNGIYGEMFVAAIIARAAVCDDVPEVIRSGLREIPASSRLAARVRQVLEWHESGVELEDVYRRIHEAYDEYLQHDWCHVIPNAMLVVTALLYGEKDFGRTICIAVQPGFDTDCNGATAGSVMGMMLGESKIPREWGDGYHRRLQTSIKGYHEMTISQLAEKTMELCL